MEQGLSPVTERLTPSEEFLNEAVAERQALLITPITRCGDGSSQRNSGHLSGNRCGG